jgi:hypothetical protein
LEQTNIENTGNTTLRLLVPVQQVEMKTERFAMGYRLILRLRLCPSGV